MVQAKESTGKTSTRTGRGEVEWTLISYGS